MEEKKEHKKLLKSSFFIAFATLISRILGVARLMLMSRILGGGMFMSAWVFAFTIPNMFRRLLGEGALGTALIPMLSHAIEKNGREEGNKIVSIVLIYLGIILALLSITLGSVSYFVAPYMETERLRLAFQLIPIIIPYAFFMCIVGVLGCTLNSIKQFFLPSLVAIILNIVIIFTLLTVKFHNIKDPREILNYLCYAVITAGFLQLIAMLLLFYKNGLRFDVEGFLSRHKTVLKETWSLTLPGLIGASVLQISLLIDRSFAIYLGDDVAPSLFYSDRLVYLPIGVFALAFGSVSLSRMSAHAANGRLQEMVNLLFLSLRHLLFICIPITFFIIVFRSPIIRVLYFGGNFDLHALNATSQAMLFYAMGIPAFSAAKLSVTGFYAQKDMRTPVKIALICVAVNITLNFLLMNSMRQGGLALATVISSYLNNILLLTILNKKLNRDVPFKPLFMIIGKSIFLSWTLVLLFYSIYKILPHYRIIPFISHDILSLAVAGTGFVLGYFLINKFLKTDELNDLLGMFKR